MVKRMVRMSEVNSILPLENDQSILFNNKKEIYKLIKLYEEEGIRSQKEIMTCLAHFIWANPTIEGVVLNMSTFSMNHGEPNKGENIRFHQEGGIIFGETVVDVKAGDELLNDYKDFDNMGNYWYEICKEQGVKDVLTNLGQYINLYWQ